MSVNILKAIELDPLLFIYLFFREKEDGRDRERNIGLLFPVVMHSLILACAPIRHGTHDLGVPDAAPTS